MNRTVSTNAVILTVKTFGEGHRDVLILTPDKGLIHTTLYGGPKSKLRSMVSPYHEGIIYLYHDPAKNSYKITDFDVKKFRVSIRENIVRTWAAALATEFIITTLASGSTAEQAYILYNGLLEGVSFSDEEGTRYGLIRFFWRYLDILGIRPDYSICNICGAKSSEQNQLFFSPVQGVFYCKNCLEETTRGAFQKDLILVSEPIKNFFFVIENGKMTESRNIRLPKEFFDSIKNIVFVLIKKTAQKPLKALECADGIL